ncbi:MAG: translocation protein TolB [Smithella sp. PtaU1.Bin162]|nr:MAG: translocation protein TolB [Smithella sp. PtaU1.Bin162]
MSNLMFILRKLFGYFLPFFLLIPAVLWTNQVSAEEKPAPTNDRPEIFVQLGHSGVNSVAFSRNGEYVLSAGDKAVKLWDIGRGREIRTFTGHSAYVASAVFSPDEKHILSCGMDKMVILWELATGKQLRTFEGHTKGVFAAVFAPDGRHIVTGGMDNTIKIWEINTGKPVKELTGHGAAVRSLAFSPDGRLLASGSWDKTIKLWDAGSGEELKTLAGHSAPVAAAAFSPDGKRIISAGGKDQTIRLWDTASGREIAAFRGHTKDVYSVAFSPDGRQAASGSWDRTVKIWDLAAGSELKILPAAEVSVFSVAFSPDGRYLLAGSRNMILWDIAAGREVRKLDARVNWVRQAAFSPNGLYAVAGNSDGVVNLWDMVSGRLIRSRQDIKGMVTSLSFTPDGRSVLECRTDGPVKLWNAASGKEELHLTGQGAAAISPDGKLIAAGTVGNNLQIWNVKTGNDIKTLSGHTDKISSVVFSPDGKFLLSGGRDKTVRLWDAASGLGIRTFSGHRYHVNSVAFSPDGKYVVSGSSDNTIRLWDRETGRELRSWQDISVSSVSFSSDGKFILSGGFDNIPKLIDASTGAKKTLFSGHKLAVYSALFSSDNKRIITASGDGTTRIWDAESGREIIQLIGFTNGEWIAITPEGYYNSSARGHEELNIRRGNKVYGIDQFYDVFYRPDIVSAKLKGEDITSLVTLTVEEAIANPPPTVKFSAIPQTTGVSKVKVCYRIAGTGGGIGEVRLFQNGKLIKSDGFYREVAAQSKTAPLKLAALNSRALYQDMRSLTVKEKQNPGAVIMRSKGELVEECVELETIAGENEISLTAFNAPNTVQSVMDTTRFLSTRAPDEPRLYILAVGIDLYRDASINLKYAAKDARDFITRLAEKAATIYKPENIHLTSLINDEAGKQNILAVIEKLSGEVKHGDSFIFFNASHGLLLQSQYYIVTSSFDGRLNGGQSLISSNEIVEMSKKIKSLSQLFIFDTCHAGGVDNIVSGLYDARMSVLAKKMGLHIFASAGSVQTALDGYQGNGLYTHTLLDGLKNGTAVDKDKSGKVTVQNLGIYTKEMTAGISGKLGHPQTPLIINFGKDSTLFTVR